MVVVTGASSGIGRSAALALAERGALVMAVARREVRLQEVVAECRRASPESDYLAGDLGEQSFAEKVIAETVERYGRIDVLINNAAVPMHKQIYRISAADAEAVMRINFMSCLWTTFAAIPHMLSRGEGCIANVSSFAAKVTPTHETIYAASKAAMDGFTRGLWSDLLGSGIHALLVHPGAIDTEIWSKLEEPGHYDGRLYPVRRAAEDLLTAIAKRRHEVVIPARSPSLVAAEWTNFLAPSLVRAGVARMDPVKPETLERARARAREGKRMGEL